MDKVEDLFGRMDLWRHLPDYQLERRTDIFFSLYIAEALESKLGLVIDPTLVPEFPIRKGTIAERCPRKLGNIPCKCKCTRDRDKNLSFRADYLAIASTSGEAVLVELKTDNRSKCDDQDNYLKCAHTAGLQELLKGVLTICKETDHRRKCFRLLDQLAGLGLLTVPSSLRAIIERPRLQGFMRAMEDVVVTCPVSKCHVVYLQPTGCGPDIISFEDLLVIVRKHGDPLSRRFGKSLELWANAPAGTCK